MAFKQEKSGDIVIDGWEKGIADSPETGMQSIQSGNITSVPGEVSVSPAMASVPTPPPGQTGLSYSGVAATDIFTVSSTASYYPGMAIKLDTVSTTNTANILIVAGGGGGGDEGGGGGAGGLVSKTGYNITNVPGTFPVVVGAGGAGSTDTTIPGVSGGNSSISSDTSLIAHGGGGGGSNASTAGVLGGSGGGAVANGGGGVATPSGEGNNGGSGGGSSKGSGGGGAGAVGANAAGSTNGAAGGAGLSSSITGSSVTYAGGGGGGAANPGTGGAGGTGGGGAGGTNSGTGTAGTANTGGGGGGGGTIAPGGNGGSGIVIISYATGSMTATGGTITTSGGRTIHSFTSSSNFIVTAVNPSANSIYYVGNLSGNTFKLYYDPALTQLVNILIDITGTYDVPSFGTPVWSAQTYNIETNGTPTPYTFILDTNVAAWYLPTNATTNTGGTVAAGSLQYMGNTGHSASVTGADFGLVLWKKYLFVCVGTSIDYFPIMDISAAISPSLSWVYGWQPNGEVPLSNTTHQHQAIPMTDDAIYICNGQSLASLLENVNSNFNPTSSSTYTYNDSALLLPSYDQTQCIAQLGTLLLVGGVLNYIYPWDRVSTSFSYPLICADLNIVRIVSTNSNAYAFAGNRGRIYICNGVNIQLYEKIPDSFSNNPEPYYTWGDALYLRNKLYFTFTGFDNSGAALNTTGGVWSLGIDAGQTQIDVPTAGSLFNSNQFSYGTYGGACPVLFYNQQTIPGGYGICGAWINSTVNGVDISSSTPYTNFQTVIATDIIPVGTYYEKRTFSQIEYKLSKPLVAGETVRISYRPDLTSAFTVVPITEGGSAGDVSGAGKVNFQKVQWVQFKIELSSTATNPSYVRLREMRIR